MSSTTNFSIDEFLQPISPAAPGGVDLRFLPEWKKLQEFRRSDDTLSKGDWETKEQKVSEWDSARDFAAQLLRTRSKDLRIAVVFAESKFQTEGLQGLVDGLQVIHQLAVTFWDSGLLPQRDENGGVSTRVGALSWLNEGLASALFTVLVTSRRDPGQDYAYAQYVHAEKVGREKDYESGGPRANKRDAFLKAKNEGGTLDLFEAAVRSSPRSFYEELVGELELVEAELASTVRILNEQFAGPELLKPLDDADAEFDRLNKLQEVVPGFSKAKEAIESIRGLLNPVLETKRKEEPIAAPAGGAIATLSGPKPTGMAASVPSFALAENGSGMTNSREYSGDRWAQAAEMVQSGQVEQGLSEMARLAVSETSGRSRFQRKLMLAEICLQIKRDRLARTILEELAEQVEKHRLDEWETSALVGGVWGHLYRIYRKNDRESERAAKYFDRLCRLDPWQTLSCSEE